MDKSSPTSEFELAQPMIPRLTSWVVIGLGVVIAVGRLLGRPTQDLLGPIVRMMMLNTAICFVLIGIALWMLAYARPWSWRLSIGRLLAFVVLMIAGATLHDHAFSHPIGVDQAIVGSPNELSDAGRMPVIIALNFAWLALGLWMLDRRSVGAITFSEVMSLGVLTTMLLALMGCWYGVREMFVNGPYARLTLGSVLAMMLVAIGMLTARPDRGLMRLVNAPTLGGMIVRRQVPAVLVIMAVIGSVRLLGQSAGWYQTELGTAIFVVACIVIFSTLIVHLGWTVHDTDLRRQNAEEDAIHQEELLRVTVDGIGDAVITTDAMGRVIFLNSVAQTLTGWTAVSAHDQPLSRVFPLVEGPNRRPFGGWFHATHPEPVQLSQGLDLFLVGRGGEYIVEVNSSPYRDYANRVMGQVLVFRDVTDQRRAEKALRDGERLFRAIFDQEFHFILMLTPVGFVTDINEAPLETTGWDRADIVGNLLWEIPFWNEMPNVQLHLEQAIADIVDTGVSSRGEVEFRTIHGQTRTLSYLLTSVYDDLGDITQLLIEARDITEQREAEQSLIQSEAQFRQLAESLPHIVWTARPDGAIDYYNERWYQYTGFPRDLYGDASWQSILHPDDFERCKTHFYDCIQHGKPYQIEYRFVDREHPGSYRWFLGRALPVRDRQQAIIRWFGTCTDIHESKLAQEAIRRSEARFRLATEAVDGLIYDVDLPNKAVWRSQALYSLVGYLPDEVGSSMDWWYDRTHPDDRAAVDAAYHDAVAYHQGRYSAEYRVQHRDGHWLYVWDQGILEWDADGNPVRMLGCTVDVTLRKQAEAQLRESQRSLESTLEVLREADQRKDEFLAVLAHELRNPLAPIRNALQIIRKSGPQDEVITTAREMMERQLSQMVRLIDDLLDLSRISRGKLELRKQRLDMADAIRSAVESCQPLIDTNGQVLTIKMTSDPMPIDGDLTRLAQVVTNLLNNAAKFTESGGRITLEVHRSGDRIVACVEDTGIGIPAAMLPKIFDMFTQVDRTLEKSRGGLGIGLTLVERLVRMHGGHVIAFSEGAGKGSCFTITLPLATTPISVPIPMPPSRPSEPLSMPRTRILVVDDNLDSARSLSTLLGLMGSEIRTAHDGVEALEVAEQFRPDIVLMDIGMPRMNGYDAAKRLREQPWAKDTFLIALTGWGQEDDRRRSQQAGFNHHLTKPVDPDELERLLCDRLSVG